MIRKSFVLPLSVAISSVLTTPAYAVLDILPGETYDVSGHLINPDSINNQGLFTNYGIVDNDRNSSFLNSGQVYNQAASTMNFSDNSSLNNSGLFATDYGTSIRYTDNVSFINTGNFNNLGTIEQWYGSGLSFDNAGRLNNTGSISSTGMMSQLNNAGEIINTGLITGFTNFNSDGNIDNYGEIKTGHMSSLNVGVTGVLNNGTETMPPIPLPQYPVGVGSTVKLALDSALNNNGVINNDFDGVIKLEGFNSSSDAVINNSGTINNTATISGGNTDHVAENYGAINNSGILNNSLTGQVTVGSVVNSGQLVNDGVLSATSIEITGGALAGTGEVVVDGGYGFGALLITEQGTIAPTGTRMDYPGSIIEDATGQMDIFGSVQLDGLFAVDVDFMDIGDTMEGYFDSLAISGNLALGANATIDINFTGLGGPLLHGEPIDLITAFSITGDFSNNNFFHDGNWYGWEIIDTAYQDTLRLGVIASPVPVPAAFWLFLSGLVGLISIKRKK